MYLHAQRLDGMGDVNVAVLRWSDLQQQVLNNIASGNTQPMSNISVLAAQSWPSYATDAGISSDDVQAINLNGVRTLIQPVFAMPQTTGQWLPMPDGYEPAEKLIGIMYALGNPDRPGWTILLYPGPNDTVLRRDFEQKDGFLKDMLAFVAAAVGMYFAIGALAAAGGGAGAGTAASTSTATVGTAAEWTSGYDLAMGSDLLSMTGVGTTSSWLNTMNLNNALSAAKAAAGLITAVKGVTAGGSTNRVAPRITNAGYSPYAYAPGTVQTMQPMVMNNGQGETDYLPWLLAGALGLVLLEI